MTRRLLIVAIAALLATPLAAAPPLPRVAIETSLGRIVLEIDVRHAPITATNFLRYVDAHKFDGTTFYRAARDHGAGTTGLIQGGIDDIRKSFFPIKHEPTSKTGLRHVNGTVSMARNKPDTAMGDFFICIGEASRLDAQPDYPGYAAFGRVLSGWPTVRAILAQPTYPGGFSLAMVGQTIRRPITIKSAHRLP